MQPESNRPTLLNQLQPLPLTKCDRLEAVVFDWAGTTVDFGSVAPIAALRMVFSRHGVALQESDLRKDMGLPKRDHIAAIGYVPKSIASW